MYISFLITIMLIAAITTSLSVKWLTQFLMARNITDVPNERSNHTQITPRGGGLALVDVFLTGWLIGCLFVDGLFNYWPLMVGVGVLAALSWLDDMRNLSAKLRLSVHIVVVTVSSFVLLPDALLFHGMLPAWLDRIGVILLWIWFMNVFNFMDGIDGISGVEIVFISICLLIISTILELFFLNPYLLCLLAGSAIGFLHRNWHPASIFMGDVGSIPIGFSLGFFLLYLAFYYPLLALMPAAYYIADGGYTLFKRVVKGERFWEAHSQHFYQQAVRGALRHDQAALCIAAVNMSIMIVVYLSAASFMPFYVALVIAYLCSIACLLFFKQAGKTER